MTMNAAEALAREIFRVARLMDTYERQPGAVGMPAFVLMEASIERACVAAGSGEALDVVTALQDLRGYGDA